MSTNWISILYFCFINVLDEWMKILSWSMITWFGKNIVNVKLRLFFTGRVVIKSWSKMIWIFMRAWVFNFNIFTFPKKIPLLVTKTDVSIKVLPFDYKSVSVFDNNMEIKFYMIKKVKCLYYKLCTIDPWVGPFKAWNPLNHEIVWALWSPKPRAVIIF